MWRPGLSLTRKSLIRMLGLASWLVSSGIPSEQIIELDWWDEKVIPHPKHPHDEDKSIIVTCTPAQHTSGKNPWTPSSHATLMICLKGEASWIETARCGAAGLSANNRRGKMARSSQRISSMLGTSVTGTSLPLFQMAPSSQRHGLYDAQGSMSSFQRSSRI